MAVLFTLGAGAKSVAQAPMQSHDVTQWGVEGRGWGDQERARWFDRFPAKAKKTVTPAVWNLSRHSAGMMVRFKTDATEIHAHWELMSARLGMPHMPPSGVSGLDLYARDAKGRWRWAAATRPRERYEAVVHAAALAAEVQHKLVCAPALRRWRKLSAPARSWPSRQCRSHSQLPPHPQ